MYSSNSSINGNDLIPYPIQLYSSRPFSIESNPTSTQLETTNLCALLPPPPPPPPPPPLSFFQFPSPFEDQEIFLEQHYHHDLLHQQQSLAAETVNNVNMENTAIIPDHKAGQGTDPQIPIRGRCSKRDRHRKIITSKGLRDRRMRLSLPVAKRFFGLQDLLGFDKASKTVDWLLNQAKIEIKQLERENNIHHHHDVKSSAPSTSECTEAMSSLDEVAVSGNQEQSKGITKRRRVKVCRKRAFKHVGKESREKARQRARERTKEKMTRNRLLAEADESKQCNEAITNNNLNRLGSWNPFENVEECAGTQSQSVDPSLDVMNEIEERNSQGKEHLGTGEDIEHEDSFVIMSKWSPTMIFNYSLSNSGILQEHQFPEFQSIWENFGRLTTITTSDL